MDQKKTTRKATKKNQKKRKGGTKIRKKTLFFTDSQAKDNLLVVGPLSNSKLVLVQFFEIDQ